MHVRGWRGADSPGQNVSLSIDEDPGLREASDDDAGYLAMTLAHAFEEDPVFLWLMPEETSRRARLSRFFEVELRKLVLPRGRAWMSSELAGAALSLPPRAWKSPTRIAVAQGRCFGIHLPKAAGLSALMERRHPREPHYYFPYIGVAPEARGVGLGSKLMRPTLERCDAEGVPAYLEATNDRNTALYERLGFKLEDELSFAGGPPLRQMMRPPCVRR